MIQIKSPRWHDRSIGVREDLLSPGINEVEILYTRKDGTRSYPDTYGIRGEDIKKYPTQTVKGVVLRIIPIENLWRKYG